jgi:hypothetical protein
MSSWKVTRANLEEEKKFDGSLVQTIAKIIIVLSSVEVKRYLSKKSLAFFH